jgi:hypothetical protein
VFSHGYFLKLLRKAGHLQSNGSFVQSNECRIAGRNATCNGKKKPGAAYFSAVGGGKSRPPTESNPRPHWANPGNAAVGQSVAAWMVWPGSRRLRTIAA